VFGCDQYKNITDTNITGFPAPTYNQKWTIVEKGNMEKVGI